MEAVALTEGLATVVKEELCWTGQQRSGVVAGMACGSMVFIKLWGNIMISPYAARIAYTRRIEDVGERCWSMSWSR